MSGGARAGQIASLPGPRRSSKNNKMRGRVKPRLTVLALILVLATPAAATTIVYSATSLGGTSWRYDYSVTNDSLGAALAEFTVYFARGSYANLVVAATPPGWDPLVVQPDADLPADGFYDALALAGGIAPEATQDGFAVTFDYLGPGTPGAQAFEVVDPGSFAVLDTGATAPVPLPGAAGLAGAALAAAAVRARRRQARAPPRP